MSFGLPELVLSVSIVLQVVAAGVALGMIRLTGRALGWVCFASAILLMAVRRGITLGRVITSEGAAPPDPAAESVALVISALMLFGLVWVGRLLRSRDAADEELARYRSELEHLVVERTRSLEESAQQLAQTQRHAAVGTLAAGIAHEINNPLGAILAATQYAMVCRGDEDERTIWERSLRTIEREASRGGRVVRGVLKFSRGERGERWSVDLREVIAGAIAATSSYAEQRGSRVAFEESSDPLVVEASPIEIGQVAVALVNNALESRDSDVSVRVDVGRRDGRVWFRVADDGAGIPDESRDQLFDPFFTTRLGRGGTGLGLSVVLGIVESHEGRIDVSSEVGRGTEVLVELPA